MASVLGGSDNVDHATRFVCLWWWFNFPIAVVDLDFFFLVQFGFGLVSYNMNPNIYGLQCGGYGSSRCVSMVTIM